MTVGELIKKLEMYTPDTEIYGHEWNGDYKVSFYCDPNVVQETVFIGKTKKGYTTVTDERYWGENSKPQTVLVIK